MLVDAIRNIGGNASAGASVYSIYIVVIASLDSLFAFLKEFSFLLLFYLKITQVWRSKIYILIYRLMPHQKSFIEVLLRLNCFDQVGVSLLHHHIWVFLDIKVIVLNILRVKFFQHF